MRGFPTGLTTGLLFVLGSVIPVAATEIQIQPAKPEPKKAQTAAPAKKDGAPQKDLRQCPQEGTKGKAAVNTLEDIFVPANPDASKLVATPAATDPASAPAQKTVEWREAKGRTKRDTARRN